MKFLVDANVVSEILKDDPDPQVQKWMDSLPAEAVYVSAIVVGELVRGVEELVPSRRRRRLEETVNSWLEEYEEQNVTIDSDTMRLWARMVARLKKKGRPLPDLDSFIAAQAIYHDMAVATRNTDDFKDTGAKLFNPWEEL